MDQAIALALIAAVVSFIGVVGTIVTAYFAMLASKTAKESKEVSIYNSKQIERVEINTNSMREQLVDAASRASYSEGHEKARVEGEVKAADVAEGARQALPPGKPVEVVLTTEQKPLPVDVKSLPKDAKPLPSKPAARRK